MTGTTETAKTIFMVAVAFAISFTLNRGLGWLLLPLQ